MEHTVPATTAKSSVLVTCGDDQSSDVSAA